MTINQAKILKSALYDAQLMELRYIESLPAENIVNSERVDNFVRELADGFKEKRKTGLGKRFILILVAAIISTLLVISISAIAFKDNLIEIHDEYILIPFRNKDNPSTQIVPAVAYSPEYIPNEYSIIQSSRTTFSVLQKWSNGESSITLTQSKIINGDLYINNMNEFMMLECNDMTIYYYERYYTYSFFWMDDDYFFTLQCNSTTPINEVEMIISSIAPIDVSE